MEDKHYAVLIDADNISSKYIAYILDEMTKYGVITYKRIYGDWTSPQAGRWKDALMENSIVPIQQFRNTVGEISVELSLFGGVQKGVLELVQRPVYTILVKSSLDLANPRLVTR